MSDDSAGNTYATVHDPIEIGVATVDADGTIDVGDEHAGKKVDFAMCEHAEDSDEQDENQGVEA